MAYAMSDAPLGTSPALRKERGVSPATNFETRPARRFERETPSDEALLMERLKAGDDGAFAALYSRYATVAYAIASRIVRDRAQVEDVVQEAFTDVWTKCGHYKAERGSPRSWMLAIVHNRAIDAVRRQQTQTARIVHDEHAGERQQPAPAIDMEAMARERARSTRAALATLPPAQRTAIGLAYFGGLTQEQVAHTLGTPLGTVKGRTRLGLARLRDELAASGRFA